MAKTSTVTTTTKTSRIQQINVGTATNAKDGDSIRAAFIKVNGNFDNVDTTLTDIGISLGETNAAFEQLKQVVNTSGSVSQRYEFSNALVWRVNHGMNTRSFTETLTDGEGNRFFAPVKILDENSFIVKLTSATSGAIDVYFSKH